jgi:hypothetical protein
MASSRCKAGLHHPSVRTEVLLAQGQLHSGLIGVTKVPQQHALRFGQNWHLVH